MQPAAEQHIDYKALCEEQQLKITTLTHELEQLMKIIFGSRSERFIAADPAAASVQLSLGLEAATIAQCNITEAAKVAYIRTKTELAENKPQAHPGRMKLPSHLRREVILLQPDMDVTGLRKIGDEVSEVLDYT